MSVGLQDILHSLESALSGEIRDTSSVHLFSIEGLHLAYDGASGAVHRLSPLGRDVLAWALRHPGVASDEPPLVLFEDVQGYNPEDIGESWDELRYLSGRTLLTEDRTIEDARNEDSKIAIAAGLKAMCLDVAHDCNLCCSYCFAATGRFGGRPHLMDKETGLAAVDFLIDSSKNRKFLDVDFFGGEPLMSFDVVKDVVGYARQKGKERGKEFRFTLTTNCTLLDDEKLKFLNNENVSLILSIDGRPKVHDAYRKYRDGRGSHVLALERAKAAANSRGGRDYFIRGTYTRGNLDFDEDIRYLYGQGFRRLSLEPAVGEESDGLSVREEDAGAMAKAYLRAVKFWLECARRGDPFEFYHFNLGLSGGLCRERRLTGCGAGYEYVAVTPQGEVYPCHQLVGKTEYLLGTIFGNPLDTRLQEEFHDARITNKPACVECWARYLCGGGCHARAVAAHIALTRPDPISCRIMKIRLEYALYAQILRTELKEN